MPEFIQIFSHLQEYLNPLTGNNIYAHVQYV